MANESFGDHESVARLLEEYRGKPHFLILDDGSVLSQHIDRYPVVSSIVVASSGSIDPVAVDK